jgi:hypothetical protein
MERFDGQKISIADQGDKYKRSSHNLTPTPGLRKMLVSLPELK